ncbi:MAG: KpsF/GutQ family sugar-phosphate isomerase, partial [Rhodobacteraceae bacterium]|nr:KpsF/GutQ family sugar-phosphate isomerase [Paracoccaceae bacterium]
MTQDDINAIAARVISIEADALYKMAGDLPTDFAGAVDTILQTKGRVIVSGVGKSGHIGNKIAATLASTGTPA